MIFAILNFLIFAKYKMMFLMTTLLLLAGFVCVHIAKTTKLTHLQWAERALQSQTWYWKVFRWIALGLCQGVVLLLSWDDNVKEKESEPPEQARDVSRREDDDARRKPRNDWNSFHCKAW